MKMTEVRQKAAAIGIAPKQMNKTDLIHTIQQAEGNRQCYGLSDGRCDQRECCFRDDCLKDGSKNRF